MRLVELFQLESMKDSLMFSTDISITYKGIRLTVNRRQSPYKSRVGLTWEVVHDYAVYDNLPLRRSDKSRSDRGLRIENNRYTLLVGLDSDQFAPQDEDWFELVECVVPSSFIQCIINSIPGTNLMGIELAYALESVVYFRPALAGFDSEGKPIFVEKPH